ncbi:BolA/IbaG family iron-sulfur metabolism protein [Marinomonas pollencensis]|uniref:BolA protein family transcriptional regulator n=1 Tax=Marinomonas pollencensis TaxID=491954 RepID=A0A3E0DRD1_9GAMM|nr:BolA/IbaG family iron-sulfur metabolism protein [Marinomonas pollencensis]REG85697.1 BolA protein family transcriptional regulator [Marinomonas pollencensis]
MKIQNEIEETIRGAFEVKHLVLENESHMHNVPAGSESHFKLVLVSDAFLGKRLVQRHQLVYGVLQAQMQKIHALALHLYTFDEWQEREQNAPFSPKCHGGE